MSTEQRAAVVVSGMVACFICSSLAMAQTVTPPANYTGELSTTFVPHTVANQYLGITEGEIGTQEYILQNGTTVQVDLKGKWSVVTTGGDPFILSSSNLNLTDLASDPYTNELGGGSNYMVALIDAKTTYPNGRIPGDDIRYAHDGGVGGGNTTSGLTTTNNGTTTSNTTGNTGSGGSNTSTNTTTTTTTTTTTGTTTTVNPTDVRMHAIEFGQFGFAPLNYQLSPLGQQAPTEHQNSRTLTSVWVDEESRVAFVCFLTLLRDTVRVQYSAINEDVQAHTVGMQLLVQPNTLNVAATNSPTTPANFDYNGWLWMPGYGLQTTEARYDGSAVPDEWVTYDALPSYTLSSRMIMRGPKDATPPDHVIVASDAAFGDYASDNYVYQYNASTSTRNLLSPGTAVAHYWDPVVLQPGQYRSVVVYYGLGGASEDFSLPSVLASEAPPSLAYNQVTTTSTSGQSNTVAQASPNPFPVKSFVYNASGFYYNANPVTMLQQVESLPVSITGATTTLTTSSGLALAPGQAATQSLGNIANQTDAAATWQVVSNGTVAGPAAFQVTGGGAPFSTKTLSNSLELPALPSSVWLGGGVQMVTFPFSFAGMNFANVLPALTTGQLFLARWDPADNSYHYFDINNPDPFVQTVVPGVAYWLYLQPTATSLNPFVLPSIAAPNPLLVSNTTGAGTSASTPNTVGVVLNQGWNQIGNPFVYSVRYAEVHVGYQGALYTLSQAVLSGLLASSVLYAYTPSATQYSIITPTASVELTPFTGYWIDSNLTGVTLYFTAPSLPNAQILSTTQ